MTMKQLLPCALAVALLFSSTTVFAKTINLYAEPKADSKSVGTANTETGISIIYTPKNSDWVKIANPTNGDVGWVKSSELGGNNVNMRIMTSSDGTHNYNVYQFGTGKIDQQLLEKQMKQFEQQQHMMQMHIANMFNDMFYFAKPIFVPVVLTPIQPAAQKTSAAKPKEVNKK